MINSEDPLFLNIDGECRVIGSFYIASVIRPEVLLYGKPSLCRI